MWVCTFSLAIKKVHDGLQDVVGILCEAAVAVSRNVGPLHLAQDIPHLPYTHFNVGLETIAHTHTHTHRVTLTYPLWREVSQLTEILLMCEVENVGTN